MKKYLTFLFIAVTGLLFAKELELKVENIREFAEESRFAFRKKIQSFVENAGSVPLHESLEELNDAGIFFVSRLAVLKHLHHVSNDPVLIREGMYGFWRLVREINVKNWTVPFKKIAEITVKEPKLSPFRLAICKNALDVVKDKAHAWTQREIPAFTYREGVGEMPQKKSFSLLTFNVCFLQDHMPLIFGGMQPWQTRIDRVTALIEKTGADIICLQEAFDPKANDALYHKLKSSYRHFYMYIAPKPFNLSFKSMGFGSGLFIASKFPLKNPEFKPYVNDSLYFNRGAFVFEVDERAKVYVTHLEPFKDGESLRKKEIEQILVWIEESVSKKEMTHILCGDLNMDLRRGEPSEEMLITNFQDPFHENVTEISLENCTAVDFTRHHDDPAHFAKHPQILDYILFYKSGEPVHCAIEKHAAFGKDPKKAASDHHALYAEIF